MASSENRENQPNSQPPEKPLAARLTEISDEPLTGKERTLFIIFGVVVGVGLLITLLVVGIMSHSPSIAR